MNANAPEKIYIVIDPIWGSMSVNYNRNDAENIEYARADAFIEKAEKYLQEHLIDYWSQGVTDESGFIEEFKQFMKGE